jgi:hypothetical protein
MLRSHNEGVKVLTLYQKGRPFHIGSEMTDTSNAQSEFKHSMMTSCEAMEIKRTTEFKKLMNHHLLRFARIARPCCGHTKATNSVTHKRKGLVSKVFDKVVATHFTTLTRNSLEHCVHRERKKKL